MSPPALAEARLGLDHLYHARLEEAAAAFERLRALDPNSPAPDFLLGGIQWHLVTTGPQGFTAGGELEQRFFAHMDDAIAAGEARLETDKDNVAAHFFLGGAYGYKARYRALQEKWWDAYRDGRRGVNHLERAVELAPDLDDAYLGLGIFHYYSDVLPSVLKFFAGFVGMSGDRERGLAEIRRAVRGGQLVGVEGRFFLAEIYTTFEEDHWTAYGFSQALRDEFPEHDLFAWVNARTLDALHLDQRSTAEWTALREGERNRRTLGFLDYRLARSRLFGGDFEGAAREFKEHLDYGRLRSTRITMWGRIRYGMALDTLGRHVEAVKQYQLAHDLDASGSARDRTSERLSAGSRDPSVISLTELEEVAAILRDTGSGGHARVDSTEARTTRPSRGMSGSEQTRYFRILAMLAEAHLRRGDATRCTDLIDRTVGGPVRPSKQSRAELIALRGRAEVRRGNADRAREDLHTARSLSAGDTRREYERLATLVEPAPAGGALPTGDWILRFAAPDRAELRLEVEGSFLPAGRRLPLTFVDGAWTGEYPVDSPEPVTYRFVVDGQTPRPDPDAESVVMSADEAWCVRTPQPKQM